MKHLLYTFVSLFLLAACQQEELPFEDANGYLAIEQLAIEAVETEVVNTRASYTEPVDPRFIVEIWQGESIYEQEGKAFHFDAGRVPGKIELPVGNYTLKVFNDAYGKTLQADEKGEPVYYHEENFSIQESKVCFVNASVPMVNVGVKLVLPEGFSDWFQDYLFSATVGERTVILLNGEVAYFDYTEENRLSYTFDVKNKDNEEKTDTGSHDLSAGTIYEVSYSLAGDLITEEVSALSE